MNQQTRVTLEPEDKQTRNIPRRGPAGDVQPNENDPDPRTKGGLRQENVEDRPEVGSVEPADYPKDQRASGKNV